MSVKDIVHNIKNKNLIDAKTEIKKELNQRAYQAIDSMKPEVMKSTFAPVDDIFEESEIDESEVYSDETIDEFVENIEEYGMTLDDLESIDEGIASAIGKGLKKA